MSLDLFGLLRADPNVAPDFKAVLTRAADKASPRRFTGELPTGFGSIDTTSDEYSADRQQDRIDEQDAKDERDERGIR